MKNIVENMTCILMLGCIVHYPFSAFFFLIYTMSPATALMTALTHICAGKNARQ